MCACGCRACAVGPSLGRKRSGRYASGSGPQCSAGMWGERVLATEASACCGDELSYLRLTRIALDATDVDVHHGPLGDGPAADVDGLGALTARHPARGVQAQCLLQRSLQQRDVSTVRGVNRMRILVLLPGSSKRDKNRIVEQTPYSPRHRGTCPCPRGAARDRGRMHPPLQPASRAPRGCCDAPMRVCGSRAVCMGAPLRAGCLHPEPTRPPTHLAR